ncbi:molybdopterin-dependent oxidoreductase [Mycolicibacterium fortuitum]|uniref:Oxidoreductase molybdopterin-binding protein n=2 Tax=Mycolicibacterium fortuitum TaxID=1766 RepID=A0A378UVX5_MYCFO|nr:molybdopterin-dependent oxidoreductase [Mycolicibacterium fortuitum]AIY49769.2 Oxidoreductase, molybdopterin-binding [Mycobacterium sp. VKM Ac-1817D]CRL73189.1 oxidoreductase molybdopterin-binding protein [Mycolicibacter nonchromogenicus]EJZ06822.1 oxidoreductase molybdopterin-binding protein [Mycolicibacterium fortuitum subsp. fortuitum DSM 46621 = ATCC 6841 = JCM 6387]WEV31900.1 molybdopterin-dependent oxidoreductase [Mycolicibacterium fortuitum]CRL52941.1 oxidoreductase molybdopterin-bin
MAVDNRLEALLDNDRPTGALRERVDERQFAGGIAQVPARFPSVRVGRHWVSALWLVPLAAVGLIVVIAVAQQLRQYSWMQDFLARYPGTSTSYAPAVTTGFPAWLRWQHFFNIVFMMFILRSGLQILADHPRLYGNAGCRPGTEWLRLRAAVPADRMDKADVQNVWTSKDDAVALPKWLGIPGIRHSIGLARWWHLSFDLLWLVNGGVFYVLLFTTGQWRRIVPQSWDVFPNAVSATVQYASLDFPLNQGFTVYNGLQVLAYFITVFVAAPLAFVTGLLQAPAVAARFGTGRGPLNRQVARTVHFGVWLWMVGFIVAHVTMVLSTGALANLNHITFGRDTRSYWALAIFGVAAALVIGLWLAASPLTLRYPRVVQTVGRFVVGWAKAWMERAHPRASYRDKDISPYLWANGRSPASEEYRRLRDGGWGRYTLRVEGLVANPVALSYRELLALPKCEQITQHYCIQGWSGVAKWGGVRMADILALVQPLPEARWVVFYSFADGAEPGHGRYYDCHRVEHMREPMALLAYEMNGEPLTETHGAPLRLRNELELGFKQVKWIEAVEFVADFRGIGWGRGGYNEDHEYFGYRMPI